MIKLKEILDVIDYGTELPYYLYHVTSDKFLPYIKTHGLIPIKGKTYFSTNEATAEKEWKHSSDIRNTTLRIRGGGYKFVPDWQWKNVVITTDTINPKDIDVKVNDNWVGLIYNV